jgi:phosphoribosylanthranilate isomerase
MHVRVKICCMGSVEESRVAIRYGASAVGVVSAMPSGPGPIDDRLIAEIVSSIPPGVAAFLLTSKQTAAEIIVQLQQSGAGTVQIVDRVDTECYASLRAAIPGVRIVQVIHVHGMRSIDEARAAAEHVDALLLDSGNQSLPVKELGGTGRVHDWNISRAIVGAVGVPVYLAGGLNASNVAKAIRAVKPFGVDVCSGVRTQGMLDEMKVKRFFEQVRGA